MNYVLVDFENVQPENIDILKGEPFKLKVFVGLKQKISVGLAGTIQSFGSDAEYIQIHGTGKNALDFHIAYYIGRLVAESPDANFYIVSKDTGFDPLIEHLKSQDIHCKRIASVAHPLPAKKIPKPTPPVTKKSPSKKAPIAPAKKASVKKTTVQPVKKTANTMVIEKEVAAVIVGLNKVKKPRTEKKLKGFINGFYAGKVTDEQVNAIFKQLKKQNVFTIINDEVVYNPPSQ